jgi:carbonic anhydrase
MIKTLLEGNRRFVAETFEKERALYAKIAKGQKPTVLWIGCSDSRLTVSTITNTKPGEVFVHRNIGNVVATNDWNLSAVLEYAINHLRIPDVVVCGHYNCGGIAALDAEGSDDRYIPIWLINASAAKKRVDEKIRALRTRLKPEKRIRLIVEENVRLQLEHLNDYPFVRQACQKGTLRLHGWVYDLETGEISVLA